METSIACVHNFVRSPRFSRRDFFSDNGINLFVSVVKTAGSVRNKSTCEPWANVLPKGYETTVVDLKRVYDSVVVRQNDARDTSERWFGIRSVESYVVGEASCRTGVRISDVVEFGQVEYLSECIPALDQPGGSGTTVSRRSHAKGKRKRSTIPARAATHKRLFEFDDEPMVLAKGRGVYFEDPNFAPRRRGCSCRAAPVFQSSHR